MENPPPQAHWLKVAFNANNEPAEVIISGQIGKSWWDDSGVSAKEFHDEWNKIPRGKKINVRINSEGGSIQDGLEIYNTIKERRADVTAHISGYAVSIASVIPLAAAKVVSPKSAIWMIHEPWSYTQGNADDHLKSAEMLNKHGDMLASIYAEETGETKETMRQRMRAETWYTGEEAIAAGLADEMPAEDCKDALARLDFDKFKNCPEPIRALILNSASKQISAPSQGAEQTNKNQKTQETIVNREKKIALLKDRGITVTDDVSDSRLDELIAASNPKAAANPDEGKTELAQMRKLLETEKRNRVTALVKSKAENKIANDKLDWWVNLAMQDETGTLAQIEALPVVDAGATPVSGSRIEFGAEDEPGPNSLPRGSVPTESLRNLREANPTPSARRLEMVLNWRKLIRDADKLDSRRGAAVATAGTPGNSYTATLVTAFLIDSAVTKLQNRWAPLAAFTRDFSTDPYKPKATGHLKFVSSATDSSGEATGKNLTNFEDGDTTVSDCIIGVDQYTRPFNVSNSDLQSGLRMENLADINLAKFCDIIMKVAMAPITIANFETTGGQQHMACPAANFGYAKLPTLWGQLKKALIKNLILDGEYYAQLINTPTFFQKTGVNGTDWMQIFGWDGIFQNNQWTGADTAVRGFACDRQAVGAIAGLPIAPQQGYNGTLSMGSFTIPQVNFSAAIYNWFALQSRAMWCSFDAMLGVKELDTSAGVIITSS